MLVHAMLILQIAAATSCAAQKVSLHVADMPLAEVVNLLRDMTGVNLVGETAANVGANRPKITLDVEDAPLKAVVKEICVQAGWHFARFGSGYHLMPGPMPEDRRPRCEVGPYQVAVQGVNVQRSLTLSFNEQEPRPTLDHRLSLHLTCETDDEDLIAAVCGFDPNVIAVTDTGVTLEPLQRHLMPQATRHEPVVHAWIPLRPPPGEAKKLSRLEGDLVLYATIKRAEFEFTPQEVGTTKESEGISVTLTGFDAQNGQLRCELRVPKERRDGADTVRSMPVQPTVAVTLVDASGKHLAFSGSSSGGGAEGNVYRLRQEFSFRIGEGFTPAKVLYRVVAGFNPTDRLTYLFEDIPLPVEQEVAPPIEQLP